MVKGPILDEGIGSFFMPVSAGDALGTPLRRDAPALVRPGVARVGQIKTKKILEKYSVQFACSVSC